MLVSLFELNRIIWEGTAREVILPTPEGEICVLDFHQPFLVRLKKGTVFLSVFETPSGKVDLKKIVYIKKRFAIKDGLAFMRSNELKLFLEMN